MDDPHGLAGGPSGPQFSLSVCPVAARPAAKRVWVDAAPPDDGGVVSGLTLAQARDVLDWLEAHGCRNLRAECPDGKTFTVRYDRPAK
jgi:hypothetical protein